VDPVSAYLAELRDIRASGAVPETSGYGALATLLNDVGHKLKPKVRCTINPRNRGAGIPDGGLFTANQYQKGGADPLEGQLPARGAIEVKPVGDDVHVVAESEQVRRYLAIYRQVLVTTYRGFVLLGYDLDGQPDILESFSLAATEAGFWALAAHPQGKEARAAGERLADFLRRVMLRPAPIASPQELAWFLASYAREARARAEERDLPALTTTRKALEESLGMSFSGEKGDHFFRSTLVQTLFYGLFAAWVFWAEQHPSAETGARFRWREAAWYLRIPILVKLFRDFANPLQLGTMHLDEVLDWAGDALARVDRAAFFERFEQQHAVQYFYEPFLEAFDPELRKELGVWYTPPEIVAYMVERVDTVLREELQIADGLADPNVVVLDPCCGTGAYLVEVLSRIAKTLTDKGDDALLAHDLKQAAMSRIYGFEILPAPFVISHLQIGMLLHRLGAPFAEGSDERAGVYLTNSLTGWEPPSEPKQHLLFPEMEEERDRAEAVKQQAPILVIIGNPPYNAFAGASPTEEGGLVDAYKTGLIDEWGIRKFNLDDLYIRFYRIAERRIGGNEKGGIVCFISSFSWLADPSAVVMREHILGEFDLLDVDSLNGDSRETGKRTPQGLLDPSVFSTPSNKAGIQVGTAVALLARHTDRETHEAVVHYRDFWGSGKLAQLAIAASNPSLAPRYSTLLPTHENRYVLRPQSTEGEYTSWPAISDLWAKRPSLGLLEKRGGALIDVDRGSLETRMRAYCDMSVPASALPSQVGSLLRPWAAFDPLRARERAMAAGLPDEQSFVTYLARPFDLQWAYVDRNLPTLWNRIRPTLVSGHHDGQRYLLARRRAPRADDGAPFAFTRSLADEHALHKDAYLIPMTISTDTGSNQAGLFDSTAMGRANLSSAAARYLEALDLENGIDEATRGNLLWDHTLAIGYSPAYVAENADAIRRDWPRVPLPASRNALLASAELGENVAALLDVGAAVDAVSCGSIRYELQPVARISSADEKAIDPDVGHLALTAGWGHQGKSGVTMPGAGRAEERPWAPGELALLREGLTDLGMTRDEVLTCLGRTVLDVYLNEVAYWRCVPLRIWKYTIGGYQVIKKWLSYRERPLLGRDLTVEEARYVTEMARRIAALLLLEPALDRNYERIRDDAHSWPSADGHG